MIQSPGQRFPKTHRLLRHADFERVYKQGRRHFAAHMTVFYLARVGEAADGSVGSRVGFTVSKALGGAVQRNRMKRRLREAVRLQGVPAGLNTDIVINPKHTLLTADFGDLRNEIAKAFVVIEKTLQHKKEKR
ncbi:MAG TPA: ribonuclease P protein component [Terriglobales bacterium]|jgi:ribonuclease P protein component|nr:ribonuclease P protein component [Terriglobales bacterium]